MRDRRLVLPRGLPGVNAFDGIAGPSAGRLSWVAHDGWSTTTVEDGDRVVFVVPSVVQVLQAAWLDAVRSRAWRSFEAWCAGAVLEGQSQGDMGWHYDSAVLAWAEAVGPDRVHVVPGPDRYVVQAGLASLLGVDSGDVTLRGWPRGLSPGEVGMAESLLAELRRLRHTGRNAAELVHGGITALTASERDPEGGARVVPVQLRGEVAEAVQQTAADMAAAVRAAGVAVHGDGAALLWPAAAPSPADALSPSGAVDLAVGVLSRVAAWGPDQGSAR